MTFNNTIINNNTKLTINDHIFHTLNLPVAFGLVFYNSIISIFRLLKKNVIVLLFTEF